MSKTFKFTHIEKKYYELEIQSNSAEDAKEIFNNTMDNKINWLNPDYLDSEVYFEECDDE